ncbi:hypothetical protein CLV51_104302 [Chitinophaga niastensis]|uniref:Carboxypeptidase-like protein n=1 Tax=Chitinophaga niastensis TaxID=536980 RepID=A0A2P8HHC0_CHINA|nr:hypothetical protein [Chitinophaga niastensis]PSL45596.1 hypothetical protein CLV51_104302 [Chitinophaga niastensis]
MSTFNLLQKTTIFTLLVLFSLVASGQVRISGTVYERSARFGMPGVSVMSTSGGGTITDSSGHYSIKLHTTDSISFSYQGKATMKFPVKDIPTNRPFDMSLHVDIQVLPTVVISTMRRSYQLDSLKNRDEYRKVFDYERDYLSGGSGGAGVGVNLDLLFSMKKVKRMEAFKRYLEWDERDKYVDHRFNKELIKKITGLQSPALDSFMIEYRPSYEMLQGFENEYEYYKYIQEGGKFFSEKWRREHPVQP